MSIPAEKSRAPQAASAESLRQVVFSLPNQLTWGRLGLTVVLFVLLAWQWYLTALAVFLVAVSTDWLDGYLARRLNLVSTLGRILDPFADKLLICGTYVFLVADPTPGFAAFFQPWMAVVILGRELLVTALRSFLEQQGKDFSAQWSGKLKMVFQSLAAGVGIYVLHRLQAGETLSVFWKVGLHGLVWTALGLTVYSGAGYINRAVRLMQNQPGEPDSH